MSKSRFALCGLLILGIGMIAGCSTSDEISNSAVDNPANKIILDSAAMAKKAKADSVKALTPSLNSVKQSISGEQPEKGNQ